MSARWSERQQAMLREMGVTLWLPPAPAEAALPEAATPEPVPAEAPVPSPAPAPAPPPVLMSRPAVVSAAPNPPSAPRPLAARPSGVAAMDWPALREAVAGCEACGLCRSRRNTVFGVGHQQAQWMIIGEAPGEQEDRQGEPFVGKAGQLLDNMLRAVGLTRAEAGPEQQVYIANVLKCRPPLNRNPEPQEVAQCEPFLKRQVELVAPKLILAMGRFAVQSILQTGEPIGRLRGRVHAYHGVPVVVTYHPAYLLRNPADKARSWDDLCLAREVLRGGATPA
ncbi:DNA polymerase-like protein [Sphaerotilus natans subsp. natans DSM 6575]|uniref:Type-4 uracil-DNA glycosylase n=1 Tax=Sphaerotilus natans subsp. natans DSM 6575 TaxID=1286631 RepID=A0A059KHV6_9BURK|nr:uracil-DNA glycosylase [Sphaerotilus natans]KDB50819.1 DNA polymerase-like protein [Sphaerotilus natans subsp. natans DSM 6575]SIQ25666.1 DNA polymerase [Sphaerotilus natans]